MFLSLQIPALLGIPLFEGCALVLVGCPLGNRLLWSSVNGDGHGDMSPSPFLLSKISDLPLANAALRCAVTWEVTGEGEGRAEPN